MITLSRRALCTIGSLAIALLVLAAPLSVQAASSWAYVTGVPNVASANNFLEAVSCVSSTFCMAVGYEGSTNVSLAEEWNGTSWSNVTGTALTGQLWAVSCSSTTFCMAVGFSGSSSGLPATADAALAEDWNGSAWTSVAPTGPSTSGEGLFGVSCLSSTFCMAAGFENSSAHGTANYQTWTPEWTGSWANLTSTDISGSTNDILVGISCTATTFCMTDGYYSSSEVGMAEEWTTSWGAAVAMTAGSGWGSSQLTTSISCVSTTFCMAGGYHDISSGSSTLQNTIYEWTGSWGAPMTVPDGGSSVNNYVEGVSCTSTTDCQASGEYQNGTPYQSTILTYSGSSWTLDTSTTLDSSTSQTNEPQGISCPVSSSGNFCISAGYYNNGTYDQTQILQYGTPTLLATTTTLTSSASPATMPTLTAVVSGGSGNPTPTGTVTFTNVTSGTTLCSAVTIAQGSLPSYEAAATCTSTLPTTGGPFTLEAVYSGNTTYATSTSATISQATNACSAGSLSLTSPTTVTVPAPTLNGLNQSASGSLVLTPSDMTGTGAGWNITLTSTTFTTGTHTLPTTATTVTGASAAAASGNCVLPSNSVSYTTPIAVPAGSTAPAAVTIYNSAASTGEGPASVTIDFTTAIPANSYAQPYNSTWTFTIVSGP